MRHLSLAVAAAALASAVALACGTDPVAVDSCRRIEQVRCESAPACGIELGQPVHRGDRPEDGVAACIRYYDDACLHGLAAPQDPGAVKTQACVDAIINGDCEVVRTPEVHPDCAFLVPPAPPPPPPTAPEDAAAPDAATQ